MTRKLLITAALLCLAPGSAHAATAGLTRADSDDLVYAADRGEANQLTISREGDRVVFDDPGATITPGETCDAVNTHRVRCDFRFLVVAQLEDGDDSATVSGPAPAGDSFVSLDGDQGADQLNAGDWPGAIDGGVGADLLTGGPLTSSIDATDTYAQGSFDQLPLRDPARDTVTCAAPAGERARTVAEVDESDAVNGPSCAAIAFYSDQQPFVVVRGTSGPDDLGGTRGPTRIWGFQGDDSIFVGRGDSGNGGKGDDHLSGAGRMLGADGDDRLDGGASNTEPSSLYGQRGADFITGSAARNVISGGPGRDRISGRGGRDAIDVRDGERDRVRCGPGRDSVEADRRDDVARDCEVVRARPVVESRVAASKARRCRAGKVIAVRGGLVVYERKTGTFVCHKPSGREHRLPNEGGGIHKPIAGAGRYLAYATPGSGIGDENDRLYVYDAKAGRTVLVEPGGSIRAIVVRPNGSVAWTDMSPVRPADDSVVFEVRKLSFAEKQGSVLLDRGSAVDPESLELDGDSITWTRAGVKQTAPLP